MISGRQSKTIKNGILEELIPYNQRMKRMPGEETQVQQGLARSPPLLASPLDHQVHTMTLKGLLHPHCKT